ncbi:MAG TPA: hypothetical protein VE442_17700 [Jatrophihabitans sp.]|nr:hypothetical protein [Jatrophihabitans sp.]
MPSTKDFKDLVEGLLGRDVALTDSQQRIVADDPMVVGVFVDPSRQIAACAAFDLPLAIYLGAAVALTPPGGAQDMVADGELTSMVAENLFEIFNVMSALFHNDAHAQETLGEMYLPGHTLPPQVTAWLSHPTGRLDLDVEVSGYGSGRAVLATGL